MFLRSKKRRPSSPEPEGQPLSKRLSCNSGTISEKKSTTQCKKCGDWYGSEKAHRAVCTRAEVLCIYPDSGGNQVTTILHRGEDHFFKCFRCGYSVRKDQNIKKHALKCQPRVAVEEEEQAVVLHGPSGPESHPGSQPGLDFEMDLRATAALPQLGNPPIVPETRTRPETRTVEHSANVVAMSTQPPTSLNKHELLIIPDEHTIVDDPLLRRTPLIVNTKYQVLICTDCKHCVNPAGSSTHIRKHHPHCKIGAHFAMQVVNKFPGLVNEEIKPPEAIEAVFGLAIPEEEYTICARCLRGYRNISSWRHHDCGKLDVDLEGKPHYFPSYVQSFFKGQKVCYFRVKLPKSGLDEARGNDFSLFQSGFQDVPLSEDEVRESDDYREVNQFLMKEGWIKHLSGFSSTDLSLLVALPKEAENFKPIGKEVIALLSNMQNSIGSAGYHLRRLIGRRPSDNHEGIRTVAHRDIQFDSLKKYGLIVTCLICFVLRCSEGWESSYEMKLTPLQDKACQSLKEALADRSGGFEEDVYIFQDADLELGDSELLDELDEDYEDLEEDKQDSEELLPDFIHNPLQSCILNLLVTLFSHLPSGTDDKFYSPIIRFLVLYSFKRNGQWLSGRRITQLFSALLFCGRQVMMTMLHAEITKCPSLRYSEVFSNISAFLDDDREGPIPTMYLVKRYLGHFSSAEEGTLQFTALDFSGDNIIVAGKVLRLGDICRFVETVVDEVKELFRVHLFFGLDVFDINWSPGVVHEEPRNRSVGYSCFQDPANSFHQHRFDLVETILTHPSLRGRFYFVDKEGKIVWKAGPCFAYMAFCHEAEMLLFSGTQTSVGEPARASEIASNLARNVTGGTIRNTLVLFQYFCMMGTFNKTSHFTGRDVTMMRVPHPEIGRLWILYLTFIRPTIVIWQNFFSGREAAVRARDKLFFGPYRPVTSFELSQNLSRHTERLLKVKISVNLWRHIVTWFLNYHSVQFREHHALLNRSSLAAQSGHSEETHTLYAGDARLPAGIDFHTLFDSMRTSGVWHRLVGFTNFGRPSLLEAMERLPGHNNTELAISPALDKVPCASPTESMAEGSKMLSDILQAITQSRANDIAALLDTMGINPQSAPSQALTQPVTHMIHPSRLHDLRKFLNNDSASFKDPQQALALELIRGKEPSLLVIGPTGSGKTLPVFMNISLYDNGATTILILPLVAMHEEYKVRARSYGLTCRSWTSDCGASTAPQLLLVAVENCAWSDLRAYIATLIRLGHLARIVVDEAHLLVKHESFRPCMDTLAFFGTLPISIILMTATCPPRLEKLLFNKLGRKVYQVLRRSTDRPEICQRIIPMYHEQASLEEEVAKHIVLTTRLAKSHERALLFCNSRDECDRMSALLGWMPYHSSISLEDRTKAMASWKGGSVFGLVCSSMLNCCLDYPDVRYVFHLGPPRDAVDYYQAIGRLARSGYIGLSIIYFNPAVLRQAVGDGDDLFGQQVMFFLLSDTSLCRRLRPGFFLDGIGVPCVMLSEAQLCDVCEAQLHIPPPHSRLHLIPQYLSPFRQLDISPFKPADVSTQFSLLPDPLRQPAPNAKFAHHLAAANACLSTGKSNDSEDSSYYVRVACNNLAKSCVNCWCNGFKYHSHSLADCPYRLVGSLSENQKRWITSIRLPVGCCFFCGCPQKLVYMSKSSQELRVHDHESDQNCHWVNVLKPLAHVVFHNPILIQSLAQSPCSAGTDLNVLSDGEYAQWLCKFDQRGFLNLLNVLLHICEIRGIPTSPLEPI